MFFSNERTNLSDIEDFTKKWLYLTINKTQKTTPIFFFTKLVWKKVRGSDHCFVTSMEIYCLKLIALIVFSHISLEIRNLMVLSFFCYYTFQLKKKKKLSYFFFLKFFSQKKINKKVMLFYKQKTNIFFHLC